jgi:hypothetical protein
MKKHFKTLFDAHHLKLTLSLLIIAAVLIFAGIMVGISDNIPGITMIFLGVVLLYFSVFHPWRKPMSFLVLAGICSGVVFALYAGIYAYSSIFLKPGNHQISNSAGEFLEGFILLSVFFVLAPGIIAGLTGAVLRYIGKKN